VFGRELLSFLFFDERKEKSSFIIDIVFFVVKERLVVVFKMGKTGTEKPLKQPKKKTRELDDDDKAALAKKKEEQAKLNALKKQVAAGGKLGKGMQKSK
jgi:hypothetical protein|tara:strand:+ start:3295 stop:3591 length:297 start_codon:yes stop_codon:yes gene_type:complete